MRVVNKAISKLCSQFLEAGLAMNKIAVEQAHTTISFLGFGFGAVVVILALSPSYAQAGYGVAPIVKPVPSLAAVRAPATKRISGSDIAYEAPRSAAGVSSPVIIQGQPGGGGGAVVEGFADQVPLNVAMQQVLPQGMGYTLSDNVNPGQLVSWRGGRPWQAVLQDMLAPAGLSYMNNGNAISVTSTGGAPAVIMGNASPMQQFQQPLPAVATMPPQAMMTPAATPYAPMPQAPAPLYDQAYAAPPPYQPGQPSYGSAAPAYAAPAYVPAPAYPAPMAPQPMQQPMQVAPAYPAAPQPMAMQQMPAPMPEYGAPPMASTGSPAQASAAAQPLQIQNPALFQSMTWEAKPGQTLRALLQDWCSKVGAELNWQAEYDYPVMASLSMSGTFEEAVRTILAGFNTAKPVPYGRLHYNPAAGQSILIVEASGNHYGD
jgi:hypothetical protein